MRAGALVAFLLTGTNVIAQPAPLEETKEEASARISRAKAASKLADVTPLMKAPSEIDGRFVFGIDATGQHEAFTVAIRAAHSVVVWRSARMPAVKEWLVNLTWDGMISGPQLQFSGAWRAPIDNMTAEAWLAHQRYNGSSENGLIGLARWCRRGGSFQVPALCESVKAAAVDRMVWDRALRP